MKIKLIELANDQTREILIRILAARPKKARLTYKLAAIRDAIAVIEKRVEEQRQGLIKAAEAVLDEAEGRYKFASDEVAAQFQADYLDMLQAEEILAVSIGLDEIDMCELDPPLDINELTSIKWLIDEK